MQALGGQHIAPRPIGNLQIFDEVEAVELGTPSHHVWQIPAFRRRRTPNTSHPVLQAKARERAIDRSLRRRVIRLGLQRGSNRSRSVFAQRTRLELDAQLRNALFEIRSHAIPGAPGSAVSKIEAVQTMASCFGNPFANHALAETKLICGLTNAHTGSDRFNHRSPASLNC